MTNQIERLRSALADHYVVERELGQGGMATVYLAQDLRNDRPVAIKVLRPELTASIGADRFLREIHLAARLQHPNILAMYESGEADGLLYYIMPFVEGESLRQRIDRERQLPIPDAVRIACEVADALQYAHDHGVIHRDIKPENILMAGSHPLIADFGIARAATEPGVQKLTETGVALGTPAYMSPEQALAGHVDGRSDQYSLGCVLYEMLIGQPPFDGPNAMAILARHSMEAVPSLQVVRHAIPDEIEDVVMQALEKTPADRFPSMRDFAEALRAVELGPATRASGRTTQRRTPRPTGARRVSGPSREPASLWRRFRVPALAAAVALLGVGGFLFWSRSHADAAEPTSAVPRELDADRIAVLFFRDESGADSLGYLADGLTETLIRELSQVKPLRVISRNGVLPYRNVPVPPDSIGRALGVGTLVDGSVRQSGDRLRVTVSLVSTQRGEQLGSTTIERPRSELFGLQDELAREVAVFLRQRLGSEIQLREERAGTRNVAAWEHLQRARREADDATEFVNAGDMDGARRQYALADSLLAQAARLDPTWTTPITERGWLAYRHTRLAGSFEKPYYDEWTTRGLEFAERALALDSADADALELRGTLKYWRWLLNLDPDPDKAARLFADAEKDFRASVAANPLQASAWTSLSHLLINKSETAAAKLAAARAYSADPYLQNANLTIWRLFSASWDLNDQTEAVHWCNEGQQRFPEDARFVLCQIRLFSLPGIKPDVNKAWELLERYVELSPPNRREFNRRWAQMDVATALVRAGLKDSARRVMERSRADAELDPARELAFAEAISRAIAGDREEAIRQLTIYLAANPQRREGVSKDRSWWWGDLWDDPEFRSLIDQT